MENASQPPTTINARSAIERLLRSESAASGEYCTGMKAKKGTPVPRVRIAQEGGGLRELTFPLDGDGVQAVKEV